MIDPIVHAALVTLFTVGVNWLFSTIGLTLGGEVATGLATTLVGYILSLFGYSLYVRGVRGALPSGGYKPPFT